MLKLLLATRFRYYRNFLRAHFDRVTLIEFGFIFLILFFLALRSPADIGYSLNFLFEPSFPSKWANLWAGLLPFFYLVAEAFALITLRPRSEAQLLGTLPITPRALLPYHLLRHLLKTFGLIFFGAALFLFGTSNFAARILTALTALALLLGLHMLAFAQACLLCRQTQEVVTSNFILGKKHLGRWLLSEGSILITLFAASAQFHLHTSAPAEAAFKLLLALALLLGAWFFARHVYAPTHLLEPRSLFIFTARTPRDNAATGSPLQKERSTEERTRIDSLIKMRAENFTSAQMTRDLLLIKRQKPSLLLLCAGTIVLLTLTSSAQAAAINSYSSTIFIHVLYCALMINALMTLFDHDGPLLGILRALPLHAAQLWRARWLFVVGMLALPMFLPTIIILIKFGASLQLALFVLSTWLVVPAIFALLLCNAAFAMFPQTKYAGILMNVFAILMLLFWFYMPFGTLILLGFTLTRVRKSQEHFQYLQLE